MQKVLILHEDGWVALFIHCFTLHVHRLVLVICAFEMSVVLYRDVWYLYIWTCYMAIKTTNSRSDAAALCVITNLFVLENIDMYI